MSETHSPETSRRDFLKVAGATATAAAVANMAYAGGSDTLKVGVVGCGDRGTGAAHDTLSANRGVKIHAICDLFPFRLEKFKGEIAKLGKDKMDLGDRAFHGLDAYKRVIDCDLDYVILTSTPGFRPDHIVYAVEKGRNIFTEKPVGVDGAGIARVLKAYDSSLKRDKPLKIVAGTQRRHQTGYLETMKRIHAGEIGEITGARCYWNGSGIWFRPRTELAKYGVPDSDVAYQAHNWYHFLWTCGDHIVEQHVHNIDVCNWAMKDQHPIRAWGMGGRSNRRVGDPNEVGNIFDHFAVEFEYPNGVRMFSFCRHIEGCANGISESLVGTKGTCRVDAYEINGKPVMTTPDNKPYQQEHADLVAAIRDDKPINELKTVAESTLTAIMGRNATYTGKMVTWKQALESKSTMPENLTMDTKITTPAAPIVGKARF